ncbi:MAG TPA: hypothetical protein PKM88_11770 [bacterium]|nr:hypothetical protein [bacterium]
MRRLVRMVYGIGLGGAALLHLVAVAQAVCGRPILPAAWLAAGAATGGVLFMTATAGVVVAGRRRCAGEGIRARQQIVGEAIAESPGTQRALGVAMGWLLAVMAVGHGYCLELHAVMFSGILVFGLLLANAVIRRLTAP